MSYSQCLATSTIDLGCASSVGGIQTIYVLPVVTGVTLNATDEITGITGSGQAYEFAVQKQTSQLTETLNSSLENGTTFFTQELVAVFHKQDADKRNQLKLLSTNRGIKIVAVDNNGKQYFLGEDFDGGFMSASVGATGVAFGDRNGYEVTFTFYSAEPAKFVSGNLSSVLTGITLNESN